MLSHDLDSRQLPPDMRRQLTLTFCAALCALPFCSIAGGLWHNDAGAGSLPTVDEAFELQPAERINGHVRITWLIGKDAYLYRERLHFESADPVGSVLPVPKLPAGETHHDEHFGDVHIYRSGLLTAEFPAGKLSALRKLKVGYQGCADSGVCYPPQTRILKLPIP